jgi:hypothetical protein
MFAQPVLPLMRVPYLAKGSTLAPFHFFLESLPQFGPSDISLILDQGVGSRLYPSEEFEGKEWLSSSSRPRWDSLNEAVEWAYDVLEGSSIGYFHMYNAFRKLASLPHYTLIGGHLCRYMEHLYKDHEQHVVQNSCSFTSKTDIQELLEEEINQLFERVQTDRETLPTNLLWHNSLLELVEGHQSVAKAFLSKAATFSTTLFTFSTDGLTHLGQLAEKFLERPLPVGITDAELLAQILPWGSRSLVFCHDSLEPESGLKFCFCYMKPIREYPPIRVEFPHLQMGGDSLDGVLDKIMAFLLLTPTVV